MEEPKNEAVEEVVAKPEAEAEKPVGEEAQPQAEAQPEAEDDAVQLPDGSKVKFDELVHGYMKDADYRKKTAELAREREMLKGGQAPQTQAETPAEDEIFKKYDKAQIEEFKAIARAVGFVSRDELKVIEEKKTKDSVAEEFFAQHPEYSQDKDSDGIRYRALKEELSIYNLDTPATLKKALSRAHEAVQEKFSSSEEKAKAAAAKVRIKAASVGSGGSSQPTAAEKESKYSPEQIAIMKKVGVWED